MMNFKLYWGDTHDNTYQAPDPDFSMERHLETAGKHLDFYCGAYYPSTSPAFKKGGHPSEDKTKQPLNVETWKPQVQIDSEWAEVNRAFQALHREGQFIVFPGFEWQGDGTWGDHNVFFNEDNPPLYRVDRLAELYALLRSHKALAIPHHTAYIGGFRGKNWEILDEKLSPFMEIYSIHGSSEGEQYGGGLRSNPFLGPDGNAGSYEAAVKAGRKLGIIASTDNWGPLPGRYGRGLAAVWAKELTRDALWEAFAARRVYGVTGDRIKLAFHLNENPMGSILPAPSASPVFGVEVEALDTIDYIDFVRDEVIIDRVNGLGRVPEELSVGDEYLIRVEYGWGPAENVLSLPPKNWRGRVAVRGGELTEVTPCWISPDQEYTVAADEFRFWGPTEQDTIFQSVQNGYVVKIKGTPTTRVDIEIDGITRSAPLRELAAGSSVLWNREESAALIREEFDTDAEALERKDVLFGMAYKAKIHPALPASSFKKAISFTDFLYDGKPHLYRIRVRQKNGQLAWSSPIWLE